MIANRPDWTLSRQRTWGVPLPFFVDKDTEELHPDTPALLEQAAARGREGRHRDVVRVDARGLRRRTPRSTGSSPTRSTSGSTRARRTRRCWAGPKGATAGAGSHARDTGFPADLYLEGSDQHRGWFHSSLLVSCMRNGVPPYRALLTHGFVVDGEGRKMSKSKGNVVAPQKISDTLGAEILRLWAGATDYSGDLSIGDEILKRVVESYRRIRNTLRFLLANTSDYDPAEDAVPLADLLELDRYALANTRALVEACRADYDRYEFHLVVQRLQTFCSEDLGGFYLDVLKDRLYTTAKGSRARRSAQTALALIRDALLELMAPMLSFTAEEAWRIVHPEDASIFCRTWGGALPALPDAAALRAKWARILAVRVAAQKELEALRQAGKIGSSLQAEVAITAPRDDYEALASLGDDLRFVLITSAASVAPGDELAIARHGERAREVRAVLALSRGCRRRRGAPDALRALRGEPLRRGRAARVCIDSPWRTSAADAPPWSGFSRAAVTWPPNARARPRHVGARGWQPWRAGCGSRRRDRRAIRSRSGRPRDDSARATRGSSPDF